ncbi:MAG TPA: PDZ domain-containing protein [Tepidisphaeraceae bacterium]|jgi:serine protease Do|nr:PDZ domain-containing protein [Tepidisphaeraceae bacterium]
MKLLNWLVPALLLTGAVAPAQEARVTPKQLYEKVTPSLVAVQYEWVNELGKQEFIGAGVVVGDDLVLVSIGLVSPQIPDEQMKDFKIIVPRQDGDPDEIDAVFEGRDERTNVGLVKAKTPQHWKPVKFEDVKLEVGERVISVGMLPQTAAYKSYLMESRIAAELRGDVPQILVQGAGLAAMGSPVFNAKGQAIGLVSFSPGQSILLNHGDEALASVNSPPKFFVPSRDFLLTLEDAPTPEKPVALPWTGIAAMTGLSKDVADALDLKNKAAIQIGEVIPNTAAEKGGLKSGDIILKVNGEALERGDEASELPGIFRRRLLRHKPGDEITFTVLRGQDKPMDIKVTLAKQPKQANVAKRYFAEDLGFVIRELVFSDTYARKLPADQKGVLVVQERQQSAAQSAGLHNGDVILRLNNEPVTGVDEFEDMYKKIRKDKPHEALVVLVHRGNSEETIRIEPPQ